MSKIRICILLIFVSNLALYTESKTKNLNALPKFIINLIKNKADHILEEGGGDTQCVKDFKIFLNDMLHLKKWALEMIDATAKLSSGILVGNIYMTGNFDECLNIKETVTNSTIYGQYCTVLLTPSVEYNNYLDFSNAGVLKDYFGIKTSSQITDVLKTIKMTYGLCIPHSCSIGNLQKIWNYVEHTFRVPVHINFIDMMCSSRMKTITPFDIDIFVFTFFGFYIAIVLLSTGYDFFVYQNIKGEKNSLWISFSLYTNAKKIFVVNDDETKENYLNAISGIKVFSMLWVIYGHRVVLNLLSGTINLIYVSEWKSQLFTAFNLSGSFAVDNFLLLSGLLLSYGTLTYQSLRSKEIQIPTATLYIYRILRLSPGLFALILFNISIFKYANSGPIWPLISMKSSYTCSKTWFATLFFMNNFIDVNYQCVEHAWYLAVDSQLFFISPIILTGLLRSPIKTCITCLGVCILSGIYTFIITIRNEYGAIYFESNKPTLTYIYQATFVRMPPWFIGIIFGYILYKYRNVKITQVLNWLGWILALSTLIGLILVHLLFTTTNDYNAVNAAIFNSTARQIWAVATGFVVFFCTNNRNGKISKFLSMKFFRILVRMSYSIYLTHGLVLLYFIGGKKHSTYFSDILNIHDFFGDLLFVFIIATVWCLIFESPFIAVAKYFYKQELSKCSTNLVNQRRIKNKKNKNKYIVCLYKYEESEEISTKKIN